MGAWRAAHSQVQVKLGLRIWSVLCNGYIAEQGVPYPSVLRHWDRERVSRKCDGAAHRHCSPNACILKKRGGTGTWRAGEAVRHVLGVSCV
jgi:hypothetical protein